METQMTQINKTQITQIYKRMITQIKNFRLHRLINVIFSEIAVINVRRTQ